VNSLERCHWYSGRTNARITLHILRSSRAPRRISSSPDATVQDKDSFWVRAETLEDISDTFVEEYSTHAEGEQCQCAVVVATGSATMRVKLIKPSNFLIVRAIFF
jgi:hypothetical protein